ncbi:MAG TPA: dicarboxylate/amino acid:cation symporter [Armatimonadaceae bacterium]|nr:dicarboxylate/amino acid:cation symporter [Armatimonadaceae bacterium]
MSTHEPAAAADPTSRHRGPRFPLYVQVIVAVIAGSILGVAFGKDQPYLFGISNATLGALGMLVIKLLRALAVPLVLFAILDAFVKTRIAARSAARLLLICLVNVSVAMGIGLLIMNTVRPGDTWRGHIDEIRAAVKPSEVTAKKSDDPDAPPGATLELLPNLEYYVPKSLIRPLVYNNIISVVLLAVLAGAAIRAVQEKQAREGQTSIRALGNVIEATYHVFIQMLEWVVACVPYAVFGVVAQVVGGAGLNVFKALWVFLAIVLAGLAIHSLIYYPLVAWLVGRKPPREYLGKGADAILTGLSMNSSLATVPITLRSLERMRVRPAPARLAACVGTNLNNDGITLYEAMAAIFLAQAIGMNMALGQQFTVVVAAIFAGAGVAGIPEAGLIVLPLVLGAAGLPEEMVAIALPLLLPVDWIIARARSGVNVMSDMLVAILLDRFDTDSPPFAETGVVEPGAEEPSALAEPAA